MKNIFQGNDSITNTVAKYLGYETPQKYSWFTRDIYYSAFFYFTKRFGQPNHQHDEDKEAAVWGFLYKGYLIQFRFASWVEIIMFADSDLYLRTYWSRSPYDTKYYRERSKRAFVQYTEKECSNKLELDITEHCWQIFLQNNPELKDKDGKDFTEEEVRRWIKAVDEANQKAHNEIISAIDKSKYEDILKKYGNENSKTRHALKALSQVLTDFMEEPVWIRDVPHNIKGTMRDQHIRHNRTSIRLTLSK